MNEKEVFPEDRMEVLWRRAEKMGMSRRHFLGLIAGGGATAVIATLAACAPAPSPSPSPSPKASASPPAASSPVAPTPQPASPSPTTPPRLINKPTPDQFFVPFGTNAEMRFEVMATRGYNTPDSFFFVRNHTSTPLVDVKTWTLRVEGDGISTPIALNYDDLLKLPSVTVTRFVECAGNGRSFFDSLLKKPAQGTQWRLGAYGVADWTGVRLSEILNRAGIKSTAVDVMPVGVDSSAVERPMPVAKAMEDDTIVAYFMNGDIIPPDHGFPARVLVPGWVGVSSVKWVGKITVSQTHILTEKNTTNYVFIGPDYTPGPTPALGPAVTTQVIKSACALPWPATLPAGSQKISGYAWSPFGKIAKVEISVDGGKSFQNAMLTGPNIERAGSRWEFTFTAQTGDMTIMPRATDDKGNTQYDVSQQKWNQFGYLYGATVPHPVKVG